MIRILHLEDDDVDAELVAATLAAEGLESEIVRVVSRADFVSALDRGGLDLILADFSLPAFDGQSALVLAQETCPEVPFIFVSGALGEERAIETLRAGATDYVLKTALSRLAPAVRRALREAEARAERRQARALLESRARQQATVARLGHSALAGSDLADLMGEAAAGVAETLAVEFCKILELMPDGKFLRVSAGVGWREGTAGQSLVSALPDSQAGYTLLSDTPVIVNDLRSETRFAGMPLLYEHDVVSGMTAVIPGRNRPFGVLGAHTARARAFTQDDANFLQAVANVLAEAVERKQAEARLRAQADRIARLQAVTAALSAGLEPAEVAEVIVRQGAAAMEASASGIYLVSQDATALILAATVGYPESVRQSVQRLPVSGPMPAADVYRTRQPLWLQSNEELIARYPFLAPTRAATRNEAVAVIPLAIDERVLGVMAVSFERPRAFTSEDQDLLLALGRQCAQALERARLYQAEQQARASAERAAQLAQQAADRIARLQAVTAALSGALTPAQVVEAAVRHGASILGTSAGALSLVSEDGAWLEVVEQVGYRADLIEAYGRSPMSASMPGADAARTGEPVWLESNEDWQARYRHMAPAGAGGRFQSSAVLPLRVEGRALGILAFSFPEARRFSPEERTFLMTLAQQCAQALERARLYEAERATREAEQAARAAAEAAQQRVRFLAEASAVLTASLDIQATLQDIARLAIPRLADFCLAFLVELDGQVRAAATAHQDPGKADLLAEGIRLLPGDPETYVGEVLRTGRPVFVPDIPADTSETLPLPAALLRELAPRSSIVVPLNARDRTLGALVLDYAESGRRYTAEDLALAEELAHRAAVAIENAELYAQAQRLNAELEERVERRTAELKGANLQLETSREELRRLSARLQEIREQERARIAREVHDELGQQLSSLKMDVAWLQKRVGKRPSELHEKTQAMSALIDATIRTVRKITSELRPGILDDFGLIAAVEWQLQDFQTRSGIACTLASDLEEIELDRDSATAVFRIFQETLTNVARHAQATEVKVNLEARPDHVALRVRDNGRGITPEEIHGDRSLGLLGMRERVHLLAGELIIEGVPGQGTTVLVKIPRAKLSGKPDGAGGEQAALSSVQ